jgi:non-homologous end joining protein Ku
MASGLRGVTLRFAHEVRPEADYFNEIPQMKLPAEMMKLAQHIIRTKSVEFDPSMLEDHYRAALVRILQKKQAKRHAPPPAAAPSRENVINLMDALRRSIPAESPSPRPQRRGRCKGRIPEGPQGPTPQRLSRSVNQVSLAPNWQCRHAARIVARPALA